MYRLFSELAGHPNVKGFSMLRPKGLDARIGPFLDPTSLEAIVSESGRLAVQVGEKIVAFFPDAGRNQEARLAFSRAKDVWIREFYGAP